PEYKPPLRLAHQTRSLQHPLSKIHPLLSSRNHPPISATCRGLIGGRYTALAPAHRLQPRPQGPPLMGQRRPACAYREGPSAGPAHGREGAANQSRPDSCRPREIRFQRSTRNLRFPQTPLLPHLRHQGGHAAETELRVEDAARMVLVFVCCCCGPRWLCSVE
ncbi:unnamed protein product, partial [Closterium sp. NIES-65]